MGLLRAEVAQVSADVIEELYRQDDRIPWKMYIGLGIAIVTTVQRCLEKRGFRIIKVPEEG